MLSAIVLCLAICYLYVPILHVTSQNGLVCLGITLVDLHARFRHHPGPVGGQIAMVADSG